MQRKSAFAPAREVFQHRFTVAGTANSWANRGLVPQAYLPAKPPISSSKPSVAGRLLHFVNHGALESHFPRYCVQQRLSTASAERGRSFIQ